MHSSTPLMAGGTMLLLAATSAWLMHARRGSARFVPELHLIARDLGRGNGDSPWLQGSVERGLADITQSLHEWATIQQALRTRGIE